jgi:hypothetical protein
MQGAESEWWRGNAHSALDPRIAAKPLGRSPKGGQFPYAGMGVGGGIAGLVQPRTRTHCLLRACSILDDEELWKGERRKQRTRASVRVGGAKRLRRSCLECGTCERDARGSSWLCRCAGCGWEPTRIRSIARGSAIRLDDEGALWFYQKPETLNRNTAWIDP